MKREMMFGPFAFAFGLELATGRPARAETLTGGEWAATCPPPDAVQSKQPQWSSSAVRRTLDSVAEDTAVADTAMGATFRAQQAADSLYSAGRAVSDSAVRMLMTTHAALVAAQRKGAAK